MARTKIVQNSFISGVFNDKAFGRTDIGRFYNGVAEAENMVLATTGGMFKRPGFQFIDKTDVPITSPLKSVRLIDFVFNTNQKYLFLIEPGNIDIYHVPTKKQEEEGQSAIGEPFGSVEAPGLTAEIIAEMNVIQRGDITLLFHTDLQTRTITRNGYEDFSFGTLQMVPPLQDIEDSLTEMWSDELGWPSYGAFYQGRLFCAGSKSFPLTVWGSKSQDYFDFQIAPTEADTAGAPINDTIDSDKINQITGIYSGRSLQVFTTGSEFINRSNIITPLDSAWHIQTRYGSEPNVPLDSLDGSTFFVDRFSAVREFIFDYTQEAHISNDLTTLSTQLFSNPFRLETVKSAKNNLGRFTYVLNDDGTLAVLNFNKAESIIAWFNFKLPEGDIIDISTVDNELYVLVRTEHDIILERIDLTDEPTFLDSYSTAHGNVVDEGCDVTGQSCSETVGGLRGVLWLLDKTWCPNCLMFTDVEAPLINEITGLERFEGREVSYVLDDIYQGEQIVVNGAIPVDRPFYLAKAGIKYDSKLKSLPIASPKAQIELSEKRIIKVKLYLYKSNGFYFDEDFVPNALFDISNFDEVADKVTGVYEHYTLGWDTLQDYIIHSDDPYGFNVLKTETWIDVSKDG